MSALPPEPPEPPTVAMGPPGRVVETSDASLTLARFDDAIRSLRSGLALVGLVAIAALGVSIYALLRHDRDPVRYIGSQRGLATQADVSRLAGRVNHLDATLAALRSSAGGTSSLSARVATLERTVRQLAARPTGTNSTQAVAQLSSRVDKLASEVSQLQSNQTTTQTQTQTTQTQTQPGG